MDVWLARGMQRESQRRAVAGSSWASLQEEGCMQSLLLSRARQKESSFPDWDTVLDLSPRAVSFGSQPLSWVPCLSRVCLFTGKECCAVPCSWDDSLHQVLAFIEI